MPTRRVPVTQRARMWPSVVVIAAFLGVMINLIVTITVASRKSNGVFIDLWVLIKAVPAIAAVMMCAFFIACATLSLLFNALLSYEKSTRRLSWLAFLLSAYLTLYLILNGLGRISFPNVSSLAVHEIAVLIMFFGVLAECAHGGPQWLIAQVFIQIVLAIVLTNVNDRFAAGRSDMSATFFPYTGYGGYTLGLGILYWVWGGLCRLGALYDCMRNPSFKNERWRFRLLIVLHVGFWFAFLAQHNIYKNTSFESAVLWQIMVIILLYSITPLALVHFSALSHARTKSMNLAITQANRRLELTQAAAEARRHWFRVVFHEVRVPFNTVLLGLDSVLAEVADRTELAADVRLMKQAAEMMLRVLNDSLDIEKMKAGQYTLEFKEGSLLNVLHGVLRSMEPWARQDRVGLFLEIRPGIPHNVLCDVNRLTQALLNLVSNAVKFVPHDGSGWVKLRAFRVAKPTARRRGALPTVQQASRSAEESVHASETSEMAEDPEGSDDASTIGESVDEPAPPFECRHPLTWPRAALYWAEACLGYVSDVLHLCTCTVLLSVWDAAARITRRAVVNTRRGCGDCTQAVQRRREEHRLAAAGGELVLADPATTTSTALVAGGEGAAAPSGIAIQIPKGHSPVATPKEAGAAAGGNVSDNSGVSGVSTPYRGEPAAALSAGRAQPAATTSVGGSEEPGAAALGTTPAVSGWASWMPWWRRAAPPQQREVEMGAMCGEAHGLASPAARSARGAGGTGLLDGGGVLAADGTISPAEQPLGKTRGRGLPAGTSGSGNHGGAADALRIRPPKRHKSRSNGRAAAAASDAAPAPPVAAAAAATQVRASPARVTLVPEQPRATASTGSRSTASGGGRSVADTSYGSNAAAHKGSVGTAAGSRLGPASVATSYQGSYAAASVDGAPTSGATAAARASTLERVWIRFEVQDNGVGIKPDDQIKLFTAFHQIDAGTLQKGGGSGLGLSICKEIVRRHGGNIGVLSTPGHGSIFFAEIPFRVVPINESVMSEVDGTSLPSLGHPATEPSGASGARRELRGVVDGSGSSSDEANARLVAGARTSTTAHMSELAPSEAGTSHGPPSEGRHRGLSQQLTPPELTTASPGGAGDFSPDRGFPVGDEGSAVSAGAQLLAGSDMGDTAHGGARTQGRVGLVPGLSPVPESEGSQGTVLATNSERTATMPGPHEGGDVSTETATASATITTSGGAGAGGLPQLAVTRAPSRATPGMVVGPSRSTGPGSVSARPSLASGGSEGVPLGSLNSAATSRTVSARGSTHSSMHGTVITAGGRGSGLPATASVASAGSGYMRTYASPVVSSAASSSRSGPRSEASTGSADTVPAVAMPAATASASTASAGAGSTGAAGSESAASAPAASALRAVARPTPERAIPIAQLRILVVEDVATNRRFLIKALRRQLPRAIITEAEDGQEALDAYAAATPTSKPSVILMDKEMPRVSGYEATRRLRALGFRGPIVGITGDAGQAAVDEFVAQGVNDVVTKPVQMDALLDIVERELTLPEDSSAGGAGSAVAEPDTPPARMLSGAAAAAMSTAATAGSSSAKGGASTTTGSLSALASPVRSEPRHGHSHNGR